ncbi:MAG TPA: hypothetical protein PLT05_02895 [bacterium]|nr:hypothetical protein [bacterium]
MGFTLVGLKVDQDAVDFAKLHDIGLSSLSVEEQRMIDKNGDGVISLVEFKPLVLDAKKYDKISEKFKAHYPTTAFHIFLADQNADARRAFLRSPSKFFTILGASNDNLNAYMIFFEGGVSEPTLGESVDVILSQNTLIKGIKFYVHGVPGRFDYIERRFGHPDLEMSRKSELFHGRIVIDEGQNKIRPFLKLRGRFGENAAVMFSACRMAKYEVGEDFIRGLAEILGVRVEAPLEDNAAGRAWLLGSKFATDYLSCEPDLSLTSEDKIKCRIFESEIGDKF